MSYFVEYDPELKSRYPTLQSVKRKFPIKGVVAAASVFAAVYILAGSGVLRHLIPGDPDVTAAAFFDMVDRIGAGESVQEAFIDFCKEIILDAE